MARRLTKEGLTNQQDLFCREYIANNMNGTKAAISAGYSKKTAREQATRLLSKVHIRQKVDALKAERCKEVDVTAQRIIEELAKMAFANVANIYDDQGRLLPIHEMPEDVAACLQEVTEGVDKEGNVQRKYKMADKKATLELLGRYLGMWVDRKEVSQRIAIEADFGLDEDE